MRLFVRQELVKSWPHPSSNRVGATAAPRGDLNALWLKSLALGYAWRLYKAAKPPEHHVQRGYAKAHDRIREVIEYGGDHKKATLARIEATTHPHKLVGIYHAAKDYGMRHVATAANKRLKEVHGHTVRKYPKPPEPIEPHRPKKQATAPKYPKPKRGEASGDYHKRAFTHFRLMGKPHAQAHAIAFSLRRKHYGEG